jgi:hypothetical protein
MSADLADFALGTFSVAGAPPFAGLVVDGHVLAVGSVSVLQILWRRGLAAPLGALRVHPPVDLPRNVYCAGI